MLRTLPAVLVLVALTSVARSADDTPKTKSPADQMQGTWLFDEAELKKRSELPRVWESVVTVKGDMFAMTKLMGAKADAKGTLVFDPKDPSAIDLKIAELDLSDLLEGYKLPAGTLAGRFKIDGDRLTLCVPARYSGKRPDKFEANADQYLATLVRAPKDFKEFPSEITLTATRPGGKPAAGAVVSSFMYTREDPAKKDAPRGWELDRPQKLDDSGKLALKSKELRGQLVVRDAAAGMIAFVSLSPAKLARGEFRVTLSPEVRIHGTLTCDELTKTGQPLDWTNVYLLHNGAPIASWAAKNGKYEFLAPAGRYTLNAYGVEVGSKYVDVTVPANQSEHAVEPIALPALAFALLKGKPAPEFEGVVGWKGQKVKLADLKGKYVLLEFWGYWCGPCIGSMPVLGRMDTSWGSSDVGVT